jgi:hypothetical protein
MDLQTLRRQFVQVSGRRNLVKTVGLDTNVDNGANLILNQAQREMCRQSPICPWVSDRYQAILESGAYLVKFQDIRSVKRVWVVKADGTMYALEPKDLDWLRLNYGKDFAGLDTGDPQYYAIARMRLAPEQAALTEGDLEGDGIAGRGDLAFGYDADLYGGLVVLPPPSVDLTVIVEGVFYDRSLTANTDTSWWSVNHPEILIRCACKLLEVDQRNSTGVLDWQQYVSQQVQFIYFDAVEQEEDLYGGYNQMDA